MRSEAGDLQEHGRADDRRESEGDRAAGRARVRRGEIRRARALACPSTAISASRCSDISFSVRAGEILGVAGRRGQRPERIHGGAERRGARGDAEAMRCWTGKPIGRLGPTARRARGLCAVPEERNGHAAVGDFTLARQRRAHRAPAHGLRRRAGSSARARADGLCRQGHQGLFGQGARASQSTAGSLSGGNLQKFIMGREIMQEPTALVGQPADLGRRRGRRGRDPAGDRRSRRPRLRRGRGLAGSRRTAGTLRFAGRHQSRAACRA